MEFPTFVIAFMLAMALYMLTQMELTPKEPTKTVIIGPQTYPHYGAGFWPDYGYDYYGYGLWPFNPWGYYGYGYDRGYYGHGYYGHSNSSYSSPRPRRIHRSTTKSTNLSPRGPHSNSYLHQQRHKLGLARPHK